MNAIVSIFVMFSGDGDVISTFVAVQEGFVHVHPKE